MTEWIIYLAGINIMLTCYISLSTVRNLENKYIVMPQGDKTKNVERN